MLHQKLYTHKHEQDPPDAARFSTNGCRPPKEAQAVYAQKLSKSCDIQLMHAIKVQELQQKTHQNIPLKGAMRSKRCHIAAKHVNDQTNTATALGASAALSASAD